MLPFTADEHGSALVELALTVSVLVLIVVGTIDLGRVFATSMALTSAARAGAQFGATSLGRSAKTTTMVATALASTNLSGATATSTRVCQCASETAAFSSTTPVANDCASPPAGVCSTGHRVVSVTVTVAVPFRLVIGRLPGVPNTMTLTRAATLRVTE